MNQYLPYIIFGLTAGSVYGISAMGLVLTYKTSGLFNFGHGAVCAAAAYVFYACRQQHGLPWPVNLETARDAERAVIAGGAVPATIAVLAGVPTVGLSDAEIVSLAERVSAD